MSRAKDLVVSRATNSMETRSKRGHRAEKGYGVTGPRRGPGALVERLPCFRDVQSRRVMKTHDSRAWNSMQRESEWTLRGRKSRSFRFIFVY